MIMASLNISKTLVLVFACLLSFTGEAAVTYLYYDCPNTTTFTPNGTYHHNLNSLLSSFTSNATGGNGFYNLTLGQGSSDIIHGLFLCRGDVTKNICQECVTTAAKEILHRCPRERVALITYDECMLRYSSRDFFSSVQREPSLQLLNTQEVSEPERFMDLMVKTMNNVTAQAADDPSGKRFATAEANFSSFQKLYTLAQCTQDLSVGSCNECLQAAVGDLPGCCNGKQGGRVVFPSCNVRYELYQFYSVVAPPPSTALLPSNPSPEQKGKFKLLNLQKIIDFQGTFQRLFHLELLYCYFSNEVFSFRPSIGRRKISSVIIIAIVVPIFVSVMLFAMGICYLTRTRKGSSRYDAVPDQSGKQK